ncbi:outer membrane protein [Methylocystis echinoides]|uniref:Outer-membrane immunogenic protein n=1 Tax=Methylocystis echinoides TaxID=29468 RepID=A0A9W6LT28_9HYPH|nr:outer-membrane immunogenic protein [Methylocystis echinoides]
MIIKKIAVSVAALALAAGAAVAADLPSRKGPPLLPPPPPPPMWTGFYAGLNAGYGFGANSNAQSYAIGTDVFAGRVITGGSGGYGLAGEPLILPSGAGLAHTGSFSNTQNGFIGGGQVGYNYQWGSNVVIGIEADIQGAGVRGTSHGVGVGTGSAYIPYVEEGGASANSLAYGATTINAGVDWLGTVRGRIGYLFTPTLLLFGTGGLTYGGAYANVNHFAVTQIDRLETYAPGDTENPGGFSQTYVGGGNRSQTLVGWNVGGGLEWMFMPNWSLKAEAIYWNMGGMNVQTASVAAPATIPVAPVEMIGILSQSGAQAAAGATFGNVRVNYQGVIARAGVNYHFNWFAPAPVVASY